MFAADLKKMLPRIPQVPGVDKFRALVAAARPDRPHRNAEPRDEPDRGFPARVGTRLGLGIGATQQDCFDRPVDTQGGDAGKACDKRCQHGSYGDRLAVSIACARSASPIPFPWKRRRTAS